MFPKHTIPNFRHALFQWFIIILASNIQAGPLEPYVAMETRNLETATINRVSKTENEFRILVYDETSGFTHASRDAARTMFKELGDAHGFEVEYDRSGDAFNSLENLQRFAVVVFSNTSGNEILNSNQQNNFEEYIRSGGSFLGIHAATDTYRTGWDWYRDLVGGSVRTNPNHTAQNFPGIMDVMDADHPATSQVPDPWSRNEEWYYWKGGGGYLYSGNINLLQVRQTGDHDYDEARPISWYKEYDGGRSFYTAMGHANSVYTEEHFRNHILGAIQWLTEGSSDAAPPTLDPIDDPEPISVDSGPQTITLSGISAGSGQMENLTVTATSSNTELIPHPEVSHSGNNATATLTFQPLPGKTGVVTITVIADNGEEEENVITRDFKVTVVDQNQPLTVTEIEDQVINISETIEPIAFQVYYDGDEEIEITVTSDNQALIPEENLTVDGDGLARTLTIVPIEGVSGTVNVTVTVSAGEHKVEQHFTVEIYNITSITTQPESFRFYPNPTTHEINIELEMGTYNISLADISGRTIKQIVNHNAANNSPLLFSVEGVPQGIYLLIITTNNKVLRNKLIIR